MTEGSESQILNSVKDLSIAYFEADPFQPKKFELSEAGKKARLQIDVNERENNFDIDRLLDFVGDLQTDLESLEYCCENCGNYVNSENPAEKPYKCDMCGSRNFSQDEINSKSEIIGPLMVNFTFNDSEAFLEFSDKRKSRGKVIVNKALSDLTPVYNTLKRIKKQIDKDTEEEVGEFDADIIESGVSEGERSLLQNVREIIDEMTEEEEVKKSDVLEKAEEKEYDRERVEGIIERLKRDGELWEPKQGYINSF